MSVSVALASALLSSTPSCSARCCGRRRRLFPSFRRDLYIRQVKVFAEVTQPKL
jgi:hypothetical protein